MAAALAVGLSALSAQTTGMSLVLCRSNVSPCQNSINLGVGDAVTLDLVLIPGPLAPDDDPAGVLAWETHLVLSGDFEYVRLPSSPPVRASGNLVMVADGLSDYSGVGPSGAGYFPVQNRFDPVTGLLDYALVLIAPDSPSQWVGVPLPDDGSGMVLGSLTVEGLTPGVVALSGSGEASRAVLYETGSGRVPANIVLPEPLATLAVGPVTTPGIAGRIPGLPGEDGVSPSRPVTMRMSLWEVGSAPPWRGGTAGPRATFQEVELGGDGTFEVLDIPPSLVPPGPYLIRLKVDGALTRSVMGVVPDDEPGSSLIVLDKLPPPLYGDSNGDDRIDSLDLDRLRDGFGSRGESPIVTDFNHDGITDVVDFSVMALSYGEVGE